jgi:hypothetical protein
MKVMQQCDYTFTLPYALMAWCLIKYRDFTFYMMHIIMDSGLKRNINSWQTIMDYRNSHFGYKL